MTLKSPWRSIQAYRRRHDALYGGRAYFSKVLGYGPIAYWPLWESSGTVARCLVNSAQNGTYSSDVSGWPVGTGIGDGNTAPRFDGTNDWVNIQTATLAAAWDGAECTMAGWAQASGAGVWTDGTAREFMRLIRFTGAIEGCLARKTNVNNTLNTQRFGNAVMDQVTYNPFSSTAWFHWTVTWSETADELKMYVNGAQVNGTQGTLGAWTGAPLIESYIGSSSAVPANVWSGGEAHCAVWDRALALSEIQSLATI